MNKKIQSIGRVVLATVGIFLCYGVFLVIGVDTNPKYHAAVIGGVAVLFTVTEAALYGILKHGEDVQKTRALAARQYEILQERIALYRRLSLNVIILNLVLRISAGVIAGCLAFLTITGIWEFVLCLIGYAAVGWSAAWFIYLWMGFRKMSDFRAKLDAVNRETEMLRDYVAKMKSLHP